MDIKLNKYINLKQNIMDLLTIILIIVLWLIIGGILWYKQHLCNQYDSEDYENGLWFGMLVIFIVATPIALIASIIRQTFIEEWK